MLEYPVLPSAPMNDCVTMGGKALNARLESIKYELRLIKSGAPGERRRPPAAARPRMCAPDQPSAMTFSVNSTRPFTAFTEWSNMAFSSPVKVTSTIFSTPPAPMITGTPT